MTTIRKIKFAFLLLLLTTAWSCTQGLNSDAAIDSGLIGADLNLAADDAGLIEDADDLSAITVDVNQSVLSGSSALAGTSAATDTDDDLVDDAANLIGTGGLSTQDLPVTMSKGDETVPPSDECGAESQGELYVIVGEYAELTEEESGDEVAFLSRVFRRAAAEFVYVRTTVGQLFDDEEKFSMFAKEESEVYQCQVEWFGDSGDADYEWVLIDYVVVQNYIDSISEGSRKGVEAPRLNADRILTSERVFTSIEKFSGVIQPVYKFKVDAFSGKKTAYVRKSLSILTK